MLLARVRHQGAIRFGQVNDDSVLLIQDGVLGIDPKAPLGIAALWAAGWTDQEPLPTSEAVGLADVRLLAPVPLPPKIICVGLNYRRHAEEAGLALPKWPEVFAKFSNSIADPDSEILIPGHDADVDWEVELCAIVGRRAHQLHAGDGIRAIGGYTVANDISARRWQLRVSQWVSGKTSDGFCPIGPWIATGESIADPQALHLWTEVNGDRVQDSTTADMAFGVDELVVYLSSILTLEPGDLILTGTPAGVGLLATPPRYLVSGDTVRVGIDEIGSFSNQFADRSPATTAG